MSKSKYQKYKSSLIGTLLYILGMSSILGIASLNVYITSYIKIKQNWVSMHYGLFLPPILTLCITCANPLGGYIEKKIGFHYSIILGNIIFLIGIFGLYLTQNIWLCYFFFVVIGASCFSLGIPLKNILFYVPEKKGFINAIFGITIQICGTFYVFIGEVMINKKGYSLKDKETVYPEDVARNTPKFYIVEMISAPSFTLLSLLFIYVYAPSFENENNDDIENSFTSFLEENNINSLSNLIPNLENNTLTPTNNENEEVDKKEKDEKYKNDIKKAIKSKQFWLLCGISFCVNFLIRFVSLTFRIFGALIGMQGDIFKYLGFLITFTMVISTLIWGCVVDKYGSKKILKITCAGCVFLGIFLFFSINNTFYFIVSITLSMINVSGFSTAITPHIMDVFTIKYSLEIGGLISLFSGLNSVVCSVLSFIISFYYTTGEQLKVPYRIIYICGAILSFIGFVLNYYETGEKFNFDDDKNVTTDNGEQNIIN